MRARAEPKHCDVSSIFCTQNGFFVNFLPSRALRIASRKSTNCVRKITPPVSSLRTSHDLTVAKLKSSKRERCPLEESSSDDDDEQMAPAPAPAPPRAPKKPARKRPRAGSPPARAAAPKLSPGKDLFRRKQDQMRRRRRGD